MGILNVTPDSFSDGGRYVEIDQARRHALNMVEQGADIIDIGGESTRPGADPVAEQVELDRAIPVIQAVRAETDVCISVDTSTAVVIQEAANSDCDVINDVRALVRDGALAAAAQTGLHICLMHMQGNPQTMQNNPDYSDLFDEIRSFFNERIAACQSVGIGRDRLLLDPGFGFGKTPQHNLMLVSRLDEFRCFHLPLLVGLSRKSTISKITGTGGALTLGSVAGAAIAIANGAAVVRVHDVEETVAGVRVANAITREKLT